MQPDSRPKRGRAWVWPAIVVALLGIHATVWIGFTLIAVGDPSFSVEPDHYKKSLDWDLTAAAMRASAALGWKAEISTAGEPSILGERHLVCRLVDRDERPVEGADVDVVTFHHARGNARVEAKLAEESPGLYAAFLRMRKPGLWECRVAARRGDETFQAVVYHAVKAERSEDPWRR